MLPRSKAQALLERGVEAEGVGATAQAEQHYLEALAADPSYAAAHCNLGLLRLQHSDFAGAEFAFRTALHLRDSFPEAWVGLAESLEATGRDDDALAALEKASTLREHYAGALFNASALLRKIGRLAEAGDKLGGLPPDHPDYRHALLLRVELLQEQSRKGETVPLLFEAMELDPTDAAVRRSLAYALRGATLGNAGERERGLLAVLCLDDTVSTDYLASPIAGLVKAANGYAQAEAAMGSGIDPFASPEAQVFACSPLVLAALPRVSFVDPDLEGVITYLRRWSVLGDSAPESFRCALARHCFRSGFAFSQEPDEEARVAAASEMVTAALQERSPDTRLVEPALVSVALYRPLLSLHGAERLAALAWSAPMRPVIDEQVSQPLQERALAASLPTLTPIDDGISKAVRAQYEESPYPVWSSVHHPGQETIESLASRLRPGEQMRRRPRPVQILVAGCGTGHHPAQVALAQPDSAILAVDLSRSSLAYAARMMGRLGIGNVTFAQADLLKLDAPGRKFDIVECAGVLHHLQDPLQGWKVLAALMADDGLMRIALYSTKARAAIREARVLMASLNLPVTPEGIRRCRRLVMDLPAGHPARGVLAFGDFYSLNGCRDLLMHVQEHTFTIAQIGECLARLGLRFLAMDCDGETQAAFAKMFPDPRSNTDPHCWDRFESAYPDTFRGMIQFWCDKPPG